MVVILYRVANPHAELDGKRVLKMPLPRNKYWNFAPLGGKNQEKGQRWMYALEITST
jgi:hypothetical protein